MAVPTREARLAHAAIHCEYWNDGRRDEWLASWGTIAPGSVTMFDPVGTKEKHGLAHATSEAWDPDGTLTIKPFYDMPESVGADDDPYEHLLGAENVIPN